jgi:RHS repeat-associated protein
MSLPGILSQAMVGATDQDKVYYYLNDHLGTPLKIVDESGIVVWEADYEPFGEAKIGAQSFSNNYRFPGQYFDSETGLQYNYHRYYDTTTGRYLTPDPIGLAGGINLYIYGLNNPLRFIDPLGREVAPSPGIEFFEPDRPPEIEVAMCYIELGRFKAYCRTKAQQIIDTECKQTFAIRPKQCKEVIQGWYKECVRQTELEFADCVEDCK